MSPSLPISKLPFFFYIPITSDGLSHIIRTILLKYTPISIPLLVPNISYFLYKRVQMDYNENPRLETPLNALKKFPLPASLYKGSTGK
jgi:hypothetical protein